MSTGALTAPWTPDQRGPGFLAPGPPPPLSTHTQSRLHLSLQCRSPSITRSDHLLCPPSSLPQRPGSIRPGPPGDLQSHNRETSPPSPAPQLPLSSTPSSSTCFRTHPYLIACLCPPHPPLLMKPRPQLTSLPPALALHLRGRGKATTRSAHPPHSDSPQGGPSTLHFSSLIPSPSPRG